MDLSWQKKERCKLCNGRGKIMQTERRQMNPVVLDPNKPIPLSDMYSHQHSVECPECKGLGYAKKKES